MKSFYFLTRNLLFFLLLFVLPLSYAMFEGGFVSWFLFFSLLPLVCYAVSLYVYPLKNWQIERTFSKTHVHAGEQIEVTLHFERKIPYPIFHCTIEEIFPASLQRLTVSQKNLGFDTFSMKRSLSLVTFPLFKRKLSLPYQLKNLPRGRHTLPSVRLTVGDPFGLFQKQYTFSISDDFIVYPPLLPVRMQSNFHVTEGEKRESIRKSFHETTEFSGVREYTFGDRPSQVDWKQTARKKKLMSKESEKLEENEWVWILPTKVDHEQSSLVFERMVSILFSCLYIGKGDSSTNHLWIFQDQRKVISSIDSGNGRMQAMVALANVTLQSDHTLAELLLKVPKQEFYHKRFVIFTTGLDSSFLYALKTISPYPKKIQVILIQQGEKSPRLPMIETNHPFLQIQTIQELESLNGPLEVKIG